MSTSATKFNWNYRASTESATAQSGNFLLRVVDWSLAGVICVAPYFFGGRHDLGRLVLVSLTATIATAWCLRQSLVARANLHWTTANAIFLLAVGLLVLQIFPLPQSWLDLLSPRIGELLPMWKPSGNATLGTWQTASLVPHETAKSLAMLICYGLLFVVVVERIENRADLERLIRLIALSAAGMAVFGIVHHATSDGHYFWFWKHPYRSATGDVAGAFINHNHFSHFVILGIGPLTAWLLSVVQKNQRASTKRQPQQQHTIAAIVLGAALVTAILAVLLSLSRGGIVALLVAIAVLATIYRRAGLIGAKHRWSAFALGMLMLAILSIYGYEQLSGRLSTLTRGSLDAVDHNGGRRNIWRANLHAIQAGGMLGSGAGSHKMIYPVYLPHNPPFEYSHAENGYLQVGTETGLVGIGLLLMGLAVGGSWCIVCLRHADSKDDQLFFGAIAAGLAVSLAHSFVDFVWYIPACMSVTVVLAAMALRMSQLVRPTEVQSSRPFRPRARWLELAVASLMAGGWSIHTFVGPAVGSVYWDRYMRLSASNSQLTRQEWSDLLASGTASDLQSRELLNDLMISQLEEVTKWDPHYARAHLRLAAKYITRFELLQHNAENVMSRAQIKDAALASAFKTQQELDAWLKSAFGRNIEWLRRAAAEAGHAVELCPLQGEGYLYLADLCFLNVRNAVNADAYVAQVLRVRPYDSEVHYVVGERAWLNGNYETAFKHWQTCFNNAGPHQLRIIYWLAGRMPAELFLSTFQPDWQTLPRIWWRYQTMGQPADAQVLLAYSVEATQRETKQKPAAQAAEIWANQASLYRDVHRLDKSLDCLLRAYGCAPTNYAIRLALAGDLAAAGRYEEAEPHYRWCLARRPTDKNLSEAIKQLTKQILAKRGERSITPQEVPTRLPAGTPAVATAPPHPLVPPQPKPR